MSEQTKKLPLTPAQRKAIKVIKQTSGPVLRLHRKPTGTACYRLLNGSFSPVANFRTGVISKLINKRYLHIDGGGIVTLYEAV